MLIGDAYKFKALETEYLKTGHVNMDLVRDISEAHNCTRQVIINWVKRNDDISKEVSNED